MIVVDTNVIAYLVLPGKLSSKAGALLKKEPDWAAPILWRSEFTNVLSVYVRRGLLTDDQALQFLDEAISLMRGGDYTVNPHQVLTLATISGCSAYDCEFVALAMDLNISLVTSDKQLLKAFPKRTLDLMIVKP